MTLEVFTADNRLVRRYASTDPPAYDPEPEPTCRRTGSGRSQALSTQPGMHRFTWDVHYQPLGGAGGGRGGLPIAAVPARHGAGADDAVGESRARTREAHRRRQVVHAADRRQAGSAREDAGDDDAAGLSVDRVGLLRRDDAQQAAQQAQSLLDQVGKLKAGASAPLAAALADFRGKIDAALSASGAVAAAPAAAPTAPAPAGAPAGAAAGGRGGRGGRGGGGGAPGGAAAGSNALAAAGNALGGVMSP